MRYKIKFPWSTFTRLLIRLFILPAFFLSSIVGSAAAGSTFGITAIGSTGYPAAKAVTSNAGAAIDTAQSKFGGASGQFVSASSQYLSIPDSADWYFGTSDFTVDLWVRFSSLPTNNNRAYIFAQRADNNNLVYFDLYNNGGSYEWECRVRNGGTYTMQYLTGARTLATGTWYHVAFVRSGTTNFYIFENGVNAGAALAAGSASASIPDYAGSAYVGYSGTGGTYLNGWLDEFRVSKSTARWTSGFTPPTARYDHDAGTVLLLHMDGTDASTTFLDDVITGQAKAVQAALTANAIVESVSFYAHDTGNFRLALYSDSTGPGTKQWESGSVAATASAWNTVLISAGSPATLTLNSGTYWLAWQWDSTANGPSYTAGAAGSGNYLGQAYGSFPASWSGGTSSTEQWSIYATQAPPTVTGIAATSGDILGGTGVTVTGTNFVSGATVLIGGETAASVAWVDSAHLTATTPAGAAGTADVMVTNPDGQSDTLADAFTYIRYTKLCAAPNRDGAVSLTGTVNTYWPGTASAAANAVSLTLGTARGAAAPIAAGDMVLVIQMQDAAIDSSNTSSYGDGVAGDPASGSTSLNRAGMYEYVKALSAVGTGGGTLSFQGMGLSGGLIHAYTNAAATATQGQRTFQVVRVPQYSSATLTSGLTAAAWNGATGGVLAVDVSGTLGLGAATVSLDGLGFRGGGARQLTGDTGGLSTDYVQSSAKNFNGAKAEGIAGTPAYIYDGSAVAATGTDYPNQGVSLTGGTARGAPANAGGGGTDGELTLNQYNSGGGGGGNGGTGGGGGRTYNNGLYTGGFGGILFPASARRVILGGGGGAGTRNNSTGYQSSGGGGGGLVLIRVGSVSNAGTITASGTTGPAPAEDGGGGGGAGGSIIFTALNGSLTGLTLAAHGGVGANTWVTQVPGTGCATLPHPNCWYHGPGGGGGGGVIILSNSPTGSDVTAGANGATTTALDPYGATAGAAGTVATGILPIQIPGTSSGAECLNSFFLLFE